MAAKSTIKAHVMDYLTKPKWGGVFVLFDFKITIIKISYF